MELLSFIFLAAFFWIMGVFAGWNARERHAERMLNKFIDEVKQESKPDMVKVLIEKHNDVFYVYDRDTNKFLTQGSSKKELEETLHKMYPGKRFGATEENLIEVGFIS